MKILHTVEFYHPSKGGSQEVVRQLSERMVSMGHDVTVVTSWLPERTEKVINGVKLVTFKISGNKVRGYEGDTESYKKFLLSNKYDVIMNYAAQQWTSDLFFDVMDQITAKKIFIPCGFSGLFNPAYKQYFIDMPQVLKKYDNTVYLSPTYQDAVFAREHKIKNAVIIPNGADEKEFLGKPVFNMRESLRVGAEKKLIMHLGSFTGIKGQPEALNIYKTAAVDNSALLFVGNVYNRRTHFMVRLRAALYNMNPMNVLKGRKIIIKSLPRQETVDALKSSDVFLFPSNIEASPLVLFEACAARVPFLTSDVGNAIEIIEWTGGGQLLPTSKDPEGMSHVDIKGSAQLLASLCEDQNLRSSLAKTGFRNWQKDYSWEKIILRYLDLYTK